MTVRSTILGLLGAVFVCAVCYFNDRVLRQTPLVGNNMPTAIYGLLILFLAAINPILRKRAFSGPEIALIFALILAVCVIPGGGFVRPFTPTLVMPHHLNKTQPGWREQRILEKVPKQMLTTVTEDDDRVVTGYIQGLAQGDKLIPVHEVPWRAWVRPLLFWLPIVLAMWIGLVGLSVVLHVQWSRHEHLPYPVATFTQALLPGADGHASPLFRNRLFWIGAGVVAFVHINNFAQLWFPDYLIHIPRRLDFSPLGDLFPMFIRGGGGGLLRPFIYTSIVGLAFFIPSDVSFSFGIGTTLWFLLVGAFASYGVNLMAPVEGISYFALNPQSFALFGANMGIVAAMLYTGRHFYWNTLKTALSLGRIPAGQEAPVWGCRVFLVMLVALFIQLRAIGIDLFLAVPYTLFMVVGFVVLGRIMAETGLIYVKCYFWPCTLLWGFVGARAIGPDTLLLMMLVTTVLFIDPREALMPFLMNSWQLLETQKQRVGRPAMWCVVAIVVGLAVAIPVTLYIRYDMGSAAGDSWSVNTVPKNPFDNAVMISQKLEAQGVLEEVVEGTGGWRLGKITPTPLCVWACVGGFSLVLLAVAARLRLTWWPIHPLMFVTWASTPLRYMSFSYLLGWTIKTMITKYGGSHLYNRVKPLMIGVIAGEVLGAVAPSIVGAIYYVMTGEQPIMFTVVPG